MSYDVLMPRKRWFGSPKNQLFRDDFELPDIHEEKNWYKTKLYKNCVRYLQILNVITILYSSSFLYFMMTEKRYLFITESSFLFIPLSHFILELIKFVGYQKLRYQKIYFSKTHFINFFPTYFSAVIIYHIMFVLFGANFIENISETFMFSCYLSTITLTPLYFHCGSSALFLLGILEDPEDQVFRSFWYVSLGAMSGAWFGAFVIPLDWNRPWQTWPIPNTIGSLIGFILGHIYSFIFLRTRPTSSVEKL